MEWKYDDSLPIYPQLVELLKRSIVSGELLPGSRLLSVREMAVEAKVNPNTMQRALQELERSGLVYSQRNTGRYVTDELSSIDQTREQMALEAVHDFMDKMKQLGFSAENAVRIFNETIRKEE